MDNWISKEQKPFDAFKDWYEQAQELNDFEPTKMTLATVGSDGMPSARVVLLKKYDEQVLFFYKL